MAAKKKYYAVKRGLKTGVFNSWEECREQIKGYPNAEYKGFGTRQEAEKFLGYKTAADENVGESRITETKEAEAGDFPEEGSLIAYVDGSYSSQLKKYAFGCVFLLSDGRIYTEFGNGDNPQSLEQRNVTGEMLGAMYAVRFAMKNGFKAIEICYDYQGIASWVTGAWRSKNELTQKYAAAMREWGKTVRISFTKVAAHTNVRYNELADQMAKKGLTDGNGVPPIKTLEEMEAYL